MPPRCFRLALWFGALATAAFSAFADSALQVRPNFLILLADDLGYGDVRCNNPDRSRIPTPHIDRLAREGMRFTDAHSSSGVCSPSRYTLLTGRYHWRSRLQGGIVGLWEEPLIAPDRLTIAGLARQSGYRTAAVGKWHLGWHWGIPEERRVLFQPKALAALAEPSEAHRAAWREVFSRKLGGGPLAAGFDTYFGTDVPNWPPFCFIENDRTVGMPSALLPPAELKNHRASNQGPALPGWSFESILATLADRAAGVIADAARDKKPFLLYLPLTTPHTPLAPSAGWRGRSGLSSPVADLIMETDDAIGRVLAALVQAGVADNTFVLFTSDNGFAAYVGAENLVAQGHHPSGPLRGYKGDAWEGGHRIPFIVRWPGVVRPGVVSHQLVQQADLLATLAAILGVTVPANAGEDSVSFLPLLRGEDRPVRDHAINQSQGGVLTLREGNWKFIAAPGGGGSWSKFSAQPAATTPGQLYNLGLDLGEQRNLYADQPERVAAMQARLAELVRRGRSTPGTDQANDVPVRWERFLQPPQKASKKQTKQ